MADDFAERYRELLTGSYDCVDRIVLNAYYPLGHTPGGFRVWWRRWHGDVEAQATVLRWYEPLVVPGPLQTEVYARAILSARPGAYSTAGYVAFRISAPGGVTHATAAAAK